MLESRSEDALVLLVKLVKSTVMTAEKKAMTLSLTDSLTDNLKARDASASKNMFPTMDGRLSYILT